MAKSTQVLTDLKTVYSSGPSTVTSTNASAPGGAILDFNGNVQLCIQSCYDIQRRITELLKDVDAGTDAANLALLQGVQQVLV